MTATSPFARAGTVARWSARLLGVLLVLLFLVMIVGEWNQPGPRAADPPMIAALIVSLAGIALAWRSDVAGGVVILAGFAGFEALNVARGGRLALGPVFPLIAVAGLLHLLAALARHGERAAR